ncbi:MAG TPA: ATP-binding cassette domain-containing protein [Lentzea sp.]
MTVLSCSGLRRRFGDVLAVDDVSFTIAEGETYGLLGPNGAGRTTTISMITGVLERDAGEVVIAGEPMSTRTVAAKRLVGYVPQELALYPDLTGRENLRFFAITAVIRPGVQPSRPGPGAGGWSMVVVPGSSPPESNRNGG